ncbi:unnamed protein product [Leptidea sinapis]|uniref:Protein krueppel n=1 Tax=Leptidea sinapis TaxID=189913 RepID=A0A5E4R751_9NEOP|nr:unnamed protein product [Leptidea sinapis]
MENICRGCLIQSNNTNLQKYSERNRRLFFYSTGIQVKKNDLLTFQLCGECYSNMKLACQFKKTCKNSERKFKSYLSGKELGDVLEDFHSYLENCDSSAKARLPHSNVPYKAKEDGNVSTNTSIRNFMKDILQLEIPDNESCIIDEVIKEHADISDDSLDSNWLHSSDSDIRLDCLSPFSITRSILNDHCYSIQPSNFEENENIQCEGQIESTKQDINEIFYQNNAQTINQETSLRRTTCTIDKNLERALLENNLQNISLDALLATPPMMPNAWAPSTPTIQNILFGENLDTDVHVMSENNEQFNIQDTAKAMLTDFEEKSNENQNIYKANDQEVVLTNGEDISVLIEQSNKLDDKIDVNYTHVIKKTEISNVNGKNKKIYSLKNRRCNECQRVFKSIGALKCHLARIHKLKIGKGKMKVKEKWKPRMMICDYCGKTFMNPKSMVNHIENHVNPVEHKCTKCPLTFSSEARLKMHQSTHTGFFIKKPPLKKYVCEECGATLSTSSNYKVHMMRHTKKYTHKCQECDAGFFRGIDLVVHLRKHTGEQPYSCVYCQRKFSRHDSLNKHLKTHTGEKPYTCNYCRRKFSDPFVMKVHQTNAPKCLEIQHKLAFPGDMENLCID